MSEAIQNAKFSGNRVVLGCVIYLFLVLGVINIMGVSFAVWPEYYGADFATCMSMMSISTGINMCGAFFIGPIYRKLTPKKVMIFGSILLFLMGLSMQVPNIIFLGVFMVLESLTATFCIHTATSAICVRWFHKGTSSKIGMCIMSGVIGGALFVLISGFTIPVLGVAKWWLVACTCASVIALLCAIFLVKDTPEQVGQKPYGYDPNSQEAAIDPSKEKGTTKELFSNPAFWIIAIALIIGSFVVVLFSSYATPYLAACGVPMQVASTVYSIILFAGGLMSYFAGKIIDKIGIKAFVLMIFGAGVLGCIAFALCGTGNTPGIGMFAVLIIFGALNYPMMMVASFIAAPIFGRRLSDDAMGKFACCVSISSCVLNIVAANLIGVLGYVPVFYIWAGISAVSLVLFMSGLIYGEKRQKRLAQEANS